MVSFRMILLGGGILVSAYLGMPEKFARDPASLRATQKTANVSSSTKALRAPRKISKTPSSVKTAPVIQLPSLEGRMAQGDRPDKKVAATDNSPILIEADGFKESLQRKIASDARWTRYFQGDSIKQLADCTVDAGRRTLDDRQIENQISEAGSDAHRSLMFCAVRIKSALVAAARKNGVMHQSHGLNNASNNAARASSQGNPTEADSVTGDAQVEVNAEQVSSLRPQVLPAEQAEEVIAANVTFEPVNEATASAVENN